MANAYSILHNYHQDLYSPSYDLIANVLQYKQGKLDANRERLQTLYNELSIIDVEKEEDEEYIEGRLQAAKSTINRYSALDLSNSGFANELIGQLSSTIDDKVKNAVVGTRVYRAEQAAWKNLLEEKPELYNETNRRFANQPAQAWITDGQAGTPYKGGGGVIHYDDYQKRWQESIPDIAEALGDNYEYVTNEYGVGMFIDKVTKRAVDRGKISGIMDSILGEKGRRQQQIDAWGMYDGVDPAIIKEQYDEFLSPKIENADYYIKNLKSLASKATGDDKKRYQASLKAWEQRKNSYLSNSFNNIISRDPKGGVRTAYQTMFSGQVKDPWLDVYTYEEKEVEREVDENHLKTLEFQEDVRQFELGHALKLRKQLDKENKIDSEVPTIVPQDLSIIDLEEDSVDNLAEYLKLETQGFMDLKDVVGNLSGAELIDIGNQLGGANPRDLSNIDKITLKIRGKDKVITFLDENRNENGNRKKLLSFIDKTYNATPQVKEMRKQLIQDIDNIQSRLIEEYAVHPAAASEFPLFTKEIVRIGGSDEDPMYEVRDVESGNRYKELLKKANDEVLTDAEQLTLDLYVSTHVIADPEVDSRLAREAFFQLRRNLVGKIGYKEFNKLPTSSKDIRSSLLYNTDDALYQKVQIPVAQEGYSERPDMYTLESKYFKQIYDFSDEGIITDYIGGLEVSTNKHSQIDPLLELYGEYVLAEEGSSEKRSAEKKLKSAISRTKKSRDFIVPTSTNDDAYIHEVGSSDTKTAIKGKKDFTELISDFNFRGDVTYEQSLEGHFLAPESVQYMISTEDDSHDRLAELIQVKTGHKPSGPITIALDVDQFGERTGNGVVYSYPHDGDVINVKDHDDYGPDYFLTEESLIEIGLPYATIGRTSYDSKFGSSAPKIQLGGSKPSTQVEKRVANSLARIGKSLAMNTYENVENLISLAGQVSTHKQFEVVQNIIDFRKGKYYFVLAADDDDKKYKVKMYKDKKLITEHEVSSKFSEQDISLFLGNQVTEFENGALWTKHALFSDYISEEVLNSEIDKTVMISEEEVKRFLQSYKF